MAGAGFDFVVLPAPWATCHAGGETFELDALAELVELAGVHGLDAVVAIDLAAAPAWLTAKHPECLLESAAGSKALCRATRDAPCGGWPGLCFDNGVVRASAGGFLRAVVTALGTRRPAAYDLAQFSAMPTFLDRVWDELYCQCAGSRARFVAYLRRAYGDDLDALSAAWGRRHHAWADVAPPLELGRFPDVLDWHRFHRDNLTAHLRWCVEAIREADPDTPIVAAGPLLGDESTIDVRAMAREVNAWGCRVREPVIGEGFMPEAALLPHEAVDRARPIAPDRELWVTGLAAGRLSDLRVAQWSLLCARPDAVVYESWRPSLRDGAEALPGLARPDGRPGDRLEAIAAFDALLARQPELASARPMPPEVAVVVVPESEVLWGASESWRWVYGEALGAVYHAFAGRGARVRYAFPDQLEGIALAYLPAAFAMGEANAAALRRFVERGGRLVAEACLARFDEHGLCRRVSPGLGLAELFGARAIDAAERVSPAARPTFKGRRGAYPCAGRREPLEATTGRVKASFEDGTAAIVDHATGAGATRLIGTWPSIGAFGGSEPGYARVILDSLAFAKLRPRITSTSADVQVALLEGDGARFLVALNATEKPQQATVRIGRTVGTFRSAVDLGTGKVARLRNNARRLKLPPAEGLVLRLEPAADRPRWPRRR